MALPIPQPANERSDRSPSTPLRFMKGKEGHGVDVEIDSHSATQEEFQRCLQRLIGGVDATLALQLLTTGAQALKPLCGEVASFNTLVQTIQDVAPQDGTEARLAIQSTALFLHGISCLQRSETYELAHASEFYLNKAMKLLRLHNETIAALEKRRRGGEQRVTVTHALIAGQAIVNHFNGEVGVLTTEKEGDHVR